jgi:SAM-dependent methyltransferase
MNELDQKTQEAWEKNWENVSMDDVLQIFDYERVHKQMKLFTRVLPKNERILEGGCGLGPYLIRLRQMGYDVAGIDYNEGPIRKIKSFDSSLPVQVGDVTKIPFGDGTFGGYLSLGVIEHFSEGPQKALAEAHRVLKPGGVLVCAVPTRNFFMDLSEPVRWLKSRPWLRKALGKQPDEHYWEQYFKKDALVRHMEVAGFDVREIHAMDHSHTLVSFSRLFRDSKRYDEANPFALKLSGFFEKHLPWQTASQMTLVAVKRK